MFKITSVFPLLEYLGCTKYHSISAGTKNNLKLIIFQNVTGMIQSAHMIFYVINTLTLLLRIVIFISIKPNTATVSLISSFKFEDALSNSYQVDSQTLQSKSNVKQRNT